MELIGQFSNQIHFAIGIEFDRANDLDALAKTQLQRVVQGNRPSDLDVLFLYPPILSLIRLNYSQGIPDLKSPHFEEKQVLQVYSHQVEKQNNYRK